MKVSRQAAVLLAAHLAAAAPAAVPRQPATDAIDSVQAPGSEAAPADALAFKLDCGAAGITAMCSAVNGGAHCDAVTGALSIILAGSCGACHCIKDADCTGRCG